MLALGSVDIYLYSPSEHFQIDQVPSILDTVPKSHSWAETGVYYNNVHDKFIQRRTLETILTAAAASVRIPS